MEIVESILLILLLCLGAMASYSDIAYGIIPNKLLAGFGASGVILDIVYYGVFAQDTVILFLLNSGITTAIGLFLYYTHSLAGGDCKLIPVLSILYPAGMYLRYGSNDITLFAAMCFAVFFGYVYLLITAIWRLLIGDSRISRTYFIDTVKNYVKTYLIVSLLVMLTNLILAVIDLKVIRIDTFVIWLMCIAVAWIGGRVSFFRKKAVIMIVIGMDIALSIYMRQIPLSFNPWTYLFTAVLLMCQLTIRTNLYEYIQTSRVKKGMILSAFSSIQMQNSRISGLPGISTEDLRDRLTESEAESVRQWGQTPNGIKQISIVKKVPFAVFLTLGFVCYLIIWRIVT